MPKNLLETYRQILSELTPPPAMVKAAQAAAAQRQTSSDVRMGSNPTAAPNSQRTPLMTSSQARMSGNPTGAPATNVVKRPAPMGGSAPGQQLRDRMKAGASPTMQGRPAPAPAATTNQAQTTTATIRSDAAAVGSAYDKNKSFATINQLRNSRYGSNPKPDVVKKGEQPRQTGANGPSPVVGSTIVAPRGPDTEKLSNAARRRASGDMAPARPSAGDSARTGSVIRTNLERIASRTGQNKSFDASYNAKAGTNPRDKALDQPNSQSPMARATNPNIGGAGGVGSSLGKNLGSGSTIKTKPKGQAQAATPAKIGDSGVRKTTNKAAKPADMSWSQKVGKAMRDHVKKGGKAGDTIMVDGKKIKVAWKDKAYQKRLTSKSKKQLEENRVVKKTAKSMLAHPQARLGKGQQSVSAGRRYRIRTRPLSEAEMKAGKKGKKVVVNFEPENNNPIQ